MGGGSLYWRICGMYVCMYIDIYMALGVGGGLYLRMTWGVGAVSIGGYVVCMYVDIYMALGVGGGVSI